MRKHGRLTNRRPVVLLTVAALLIVVGLVSAMNAPGAPPRSNKADAYGGPVPTQPTNPKSVGDCNKYYGASNNLAEARQCRAVAKKNAGMKACAKKKGAAKKSCQAAVRKRFAKDNGAVAQQKKAEKACNDKYTASVNALSPDDPDYDAKSQAASDTYSACMKKARGG